LAHDVLEGRGMSGPHDRLARYTFGHPRRAEAELRAVLPERITAAVDWSSLRQEQISVVDEALKETRRDLLFSARLRTGKQVWMYVLLEHQSSVDRWMAWRMLRYVQRLGDKWREEHPESMRMPVIIPLVLYHGEEGRWTAPRRVEELYDIPEGEEWSELVPRMKYLLDDLTAEKEEALRARPGPALVRLTWLLLRHGRSEELAERLPEWTALFAEVYATPDGVEKLGRVVRYLLYVGGREAHEVAGQVLHSVMDAQRAEELMRSYGEELIEQGRQQGRAEILLRILAARGVQVGEEARQRILTCTDTSRLDRWVDRALNATRLSDVLDDLPQ